MKRNISTVIIAALTAAVTVGAMQSLLSAFADQSERVPPTSGGFTGVQFSQKLGDAFRSVSTGNKGNSAPANVGGSTVDGLDWLDDTTSTWLKKRYVNGGWAVEGAYGASDSSWIGVIGGGAPASIDSATGPVIDLGSVPQANVLITGTSPITGLGSSAPTGIIKIIRFDNALKLTNSGALAVPGGFDLTTAANDRAIVTHLGSGNWEVTQYTRANGIPIDISAVGKVSYDLSESVPALHVAGYGQALTRTSYPAYLSKVTRAQNGTRTSGNATITSVSNTSGLGAGMPVESTGVNAGCTIASVTSSSITLNSSSCVTSSGTSTITVFLYGYGSGGSSSTVGVQDCRGRTVAGRDRNDPGSLANRLTSSFFGADSSLFGVAGTSSEKMPGLATTHLPPQPAPSGTVSVAASVPFVHGTITLPVTGSLIDWVSPTSSTAVNITSATFTGNALTGQNSTPFSIVPPTFIAECVVRVIP